MAGMVVGEGWRERQERLERFNSAVLNPFHRDSDDDQGGADKRLEHTNT